MHRILARWSLSGSSLGASALTALSLGGTLALAACVGPTGAEGPKGATGAPGLPGQPGEPGQPGQPGIQGETGPTGDPGADGTDGVNGQDADSHEGVGPWGVNLTLVSIGGGSGADGAFAIGDYPVITFSVLDDDGNGYNLSELDAVYFQLAGPTSHYQTALHYRDLASVIDTAVYNADGTWTYTSDLPIPATYDAASNDTPDLGIDDGDLSGEPLVDGTYTLGAWAYLEVTDAEGDTYDQSSNATQDVLLGAATTIEPRSVVLAERCADCHGEEFEAHGGSRRELGLCLTCHVDGAEDRYSSTDPTVTPGVTVSMGPMVHRLHMGSSLANGYQVAGYPSDETATGYPDYNLVDFSDVSFPSWPMASADCDACHAGAIDGDVENRPGRAACGACHDAIDFDEIDATAETYHLGGPQADDTNCATCHTADYILDYHDDPRLTDTIWGTAGHEAGKLGLNVDLLSAVNQDGASVFEPGDTVTITFTVKYDDGTDVPQSFFAYSESSSDCPTVAGSATAKFGGPSQYMQLLLSSSSPSSDTVVGSVYGSSTVDTAGVWTYTFSDSDGVALTLPDTYPAQENDAELLVGASFGGWLDQAVISGTYRVGLAMYTSMWDDTYCRDEATRWRKPASDYLDVLVGDATVLEPRAVVSNSDCEDCHNTVEFHGSGRLGTDYCIQCHTPGATDSETNPLVSIDFPLMIHKIHATEMLENGYEVDGTGFDGSFPRQDGGVLACEACHGSNEAWLTATSRGCVTCHDSDATMAHAAVNTDDTYGESCDVCHDASSDYPVAGVHAWLE